MNDETKIQDQREQRRIEALMRLKAKQPLLEVQAVQAAKKAAQQK
jgi:hypothetical protein